MTGRQTRIASVLVSLLVIGLISAGCKPSTSIQINPTPAPTSNGINTPLNSSGEKRKTEETNSPESGQRGEGGARTNVAESSAEQIMGIPSGQLMNIGLLLMSSAGLIAGLLGIHKGQRAKYTIIEYANRHRILEKKVANDNATLWARLEKFDGEIKTTSFKLKNTENKVELINARITDLSLDLSNRPKNPTPHDNSSRGQVSLHQWGDDQRLAVGQERSPVSSSDQVTQSLDLLQIPPYGATPIRNTEQRLNEITAAVNNNDRQAIKFAIRTQLNITNDSENDIAIGRQVQTELEAVTGGGSYLLLEIENKLLLYPTEQTLQGFRETQPTKGIFDYTRQPLVTPQVLTPALLEKAGLNWRVQQIGMIAVPG